MKKSSIHVEKLLNMLDKDYIITGFPYKIRIMLKHLQGPFKDEKLKEIRGWVKQNTEHKGYKVVFTYNYLDIYFKNEEDAALCSLTWT